MSIIDCFDSDQLILLATLLALLISEDLTADELNVIGNFIVAVGSLMLTKAAELSSQQSSSADMQQQIDEMKKQIDEIQSAH